MLKNPWSILAYQLAGPDGLKLIHAEGIDTERETPAAERRMAALLSKPQEYGLYTLLLLYEVLMYTLAQTDADPASRIRLPSFFQYLTQAVAKVDRCATVASLLAPTPGSTMTSDRSCPGTCPRYSASRWRCSQPDEQG